MKILVAIKRVVDYNVKVHVLPDGTGLDIADAHRSMNPFDEIAVEAAVRAKEAGKATEVVVATIGPAKSLDCLRTALAMGADNAVHVQCDQHIGPWTVAQILEKVCEEEKPDLVLLGKQAIDDDAGQVPGMLSALLNVPFATAVDKLEFEDGSVLASRETDDGILTVKLALPAVVSADLRLSEPRYVTLPSMIKARKKPVRAVPVADYGVSLDPAITVVSYEEPPQRTGGVELHSVDELLEKLRNEKKVL